MSRNRVLMLGMIATLAVLTWALPAAAQHAGAAGAAVTTVTVAAGAPNEFSFTVAPKTVKRGIVTFKVTNKGNLPHDFQINRRKTRLLSPGSSTTLRVTFLKTGKYTYMCTVSGHAAAGMKGTIVVK
jgi:uncharacterized cupredoxin-like copper-binding protein